MYRVVHMIARQSKLLQYLQVVFQQQDIPSAAAAAAHEMLLSATSFIMQCAVTM
jgi:hypothetical protein